MVRRSIRRKGLIVRGNDMKRAVRKDVVGEGVVGRDVLIVV